MAAQPQVSLVRGQRMLLSLYASTTTLSGADTGEGAALMGEEGKGEGEGEEEEEGG